MRLYRFYFRKTSFIEIRRDKFFSYFRKLNLIKIGATRKTGGFTYTKKTIDFNFLPSLNIQVFFYLWFSFKKASIVFLDSLSALSLISAVPPVAILIFPKFKTPLLANICPAPLYE